MGFKFNKMESQILNQWVSKKIEVTQRENYKIKGTFHHQDKAGNLLMKEVTYKGYDGKEV